MVIEDFILMNWRNNLIPFVRAPPLWANHLPKAWSPNSSLWEVLQWILGDTLLLYGVRTTFKSETIHSFVTGLGRYLSKVVVWESQLPGPGKREAYDTGSPTLEGGESSALMGSYAWQNDLHWPNAGRGRGLVLVTHCAATRSELRVFFIFFFLRGGVQSWLESQTTMPSGLSNHCDSSFCRV